MTADVPIEALSARLRSATRESHERLEADLNLIWNGMDLARYTQLLRRWYGFVQPWESSGAAVFSGELAGFFDARRKTPAIAADLLACGVPANEMELLPCCDPVALPFAEPSAALGVLYVLEGSTLGGQIIFKRIHEQLGLTPSNGAAYFSSYGKNVMPMWQETNRLLDAPPFVVEHDRVVQGAVDTFNFLSGWLRG